MESFEAETLILAGSGTVWDIITDGGNYPVWDSGITDVNGKVGHGERIRVRTRDGGKRNFRLRVDQIPGKLMTWTGGLPLGLLQLERTFTLADYTGITHLKVRDTAKGPLTGLVRKTAPGTHPALTESFPAHPSPPHRTTPGRRPNRAGAPAKSHPLHGQLPGR